jgi:hypothetical protein
MVQMFYYENRGKCCKKLLRYNGYPSKVRGPSAGPTRVLYLSLSLPACICVCVCVCVCIYIYIYIHTHT